MEKNLKTPEYQRKASIKYQLEKRCKLTLDVTPEQRERINAYCKPFGGTAAHIKALLRADMVAHGTQPFDQVTSSEQTED